MFINHFYYLWNGYLFWSLIIEFVAVTYFLNLATFSINVSIALLLFTFAPGLLAFKSVREHVYPHHWLLAVLISAAIGGTLLPAMWRAVFLGIGCAALLLQFASAWLCTTRTYYIWGLIAGLLLLLCLRLWCISLNPLWLSGYSRGIAIMLTLAAIASQWRKTRAIAVSNAHNCKWWATAIALGSILFLTHWLFTGSGVIPRWVGLQPLTGMYILIAILIGFWGTAFAVLRRFVWLNIVVGAGCVAYGNGVWGLVGGILLGLAIPICWFTVVSALDTGRPGRIFLTGIAMYLLLMLATIFAVVYDYVPAGNLFREREQIVLLVAALLLLPSLRKTPHIQQNYECGPMVVLTGLIAGALLIGFVIYKAPSPRTKQPVAMTFNIQQGYDIAGNVNFVPAAEMLAASKATIIGLQETDTLRVSAANRDVVQWLAQRLHMYSYFGPPTRDSTFGNALLSAYPIIKAQSIILPSSGELAVLLVTVVRLPQTSINVLVAHFGEKEFDRNQQAIATAKIIRSLTGATLLLGDFNSVPNSFPIQTIINEGLRDAYADTHQNQHVATTIGRNPQTIDFIFYRGFRLKTVRVLEIGAIADHKPVIASLLME